MIWLRHIRSKNFYNKINRNFLKDNNRLRHVLNYFSIYLHMININIVIRVSDEQ